MDVVPDVGRIAALVGVAARGRMLTALMEGRALTATELALEGEVSPATASSHLEKLTRAGLLSIARQGRHRYYRIARPEVAAALEALMTIAPRTAPRPPFGPRDEGLRHARVCYDHLAGDAAVRLCEALRRRGRLRVSPSGDTIAATREGEAWFRSLGVDVAALRAGRRPLCRPCLDWSERRFHLGGALGAALLESLFARRLARRLPDSRAVLFTPRGTAFLDELGNRGER